MDRRLAAVLAADVAGFSALVGRDEDGAVRALKGHLATLEPMIGINGGRLVKTTGDGFLAEFSSVVAAVSCAATMQRQMAERNAAQQDALRMQFRMGVHVGDVVIDGDDILGDGVNIAARLQGVAQPGGVVISSRVHEDVSGKTDLAFSDLGEQRLKNIARSVGAHAILIGPPAAARAPEPERPSKPSVAVLAFENLSSDPEQDYFADGITEDIITALSRVPWMFVIARNSSFSYKGLAVDVRRVGRELGVRYVLEGSVRKAGQRLRVTGQLVDTGTGAHLWADRFDGQVEDVFELQDRITEAVVGAIAPQIRHAEIERAAGKRPESLDAYDHFLRAQAAVHRFQFRAADEHLAAAIARAPGYTIAKAMRAWVRTIVWHPEAAELADDTETALRLAAEVLAAVDADIEAKGYAGYVTAFLGEDFAGGLDHVEQATAICPNCVSAWGSSCLLHGLRGDVETALAHGERALRLNPRDPMAFRVHMGMALALLTARDYDGLLVRLEATRNFAAPVQAFLIYEVAARQHLGQTERARALAGRIMAAEPNLTIGRIRQTRQRVRAMAHPLYEDFYAGLVAAGIPE